ncbi:MAG TPA: hypothetical protein GX747_01060 [Tenericutes bacterium]|nr:hypothetical protein [Mycoplasmatota bacterium]
MKKNTLFIFVVVMITFMFGYSDVKAGKAVCKYSVNDTTITVTIEDNNIETKVGYLVGTKIYSNNLTVRNFQDNDGKLKCLNELWYNITVGSNRIGSVKISHTKSKDTNRSIELVSSTYEQDETPVVYDNVCQYGNHYLSFNSEKYIIQLDGYSLGAVYFSVDELNALNGCPSQLYFICTTRQVSMCAVSLTAKGSGVFIPLTTDKVPNQDEIENPQPEAPVEEEDQTGGNEVCGVMSVEMADKLRWILDIIKYGGVILAIGLGMFDFAKAVFSDEADANKKAGQKFVKRLISAVIIFIVPLILQIFLNIIEIDGVDLDNPFCIQLDQ